jgi:hypothetical protein
MARQARGTTRQQTPDDGAETRLVEERAIDEEPHADTLRRRAAEGKRGIRVVACAVVR